jgi:hypothetical protein
MFSSLTTRLQVLLYKMKTKVQLGNIAWLTGWLAGWLNER